MPYGGYHPYPRRFGGGRPLLRIVHDSLNAARGTAMDATKTDTVVWVKTMAAARAIAIDGYGMNERLAAQWDPNRMTVFLARWEKILGITPSPTATERARREVVRRRFRRFLDASALHSRLVSRLQEELGDVFLAVEYIDIANAVVHAPDPNYPWGTVVAGFPWYSTVAHVLVLLQKPAGYTEGDFYVAAGKVVPAVDGMLPAWVTVNWYRAPQNYPSVSVAGGPSQAGFILGAPSNLGNNVFGANP